jgi:hypothetical protein
MYFDGGVGAHRNLEEDICAGGYRYCDYTE